ncbi:alpha/beta fold hydrolase [Winogradskyella maritima]|uniref:Alpha/beta fold hydrolase n=1 Tax=Winogradskyella maritima TaxID=1517766 RepID=A0ABV8AEF8_9FLAO|nr:alpha/beta fold hydrolase [Winogradskyella maritima]
MTEALKFLDIQHFALSCGAEISLRLSYQTFGCALGSAPVIMVNHALTGHSNVSGEHGWWSKLIGDAKTINTTQFTVICINTPGNGYGNYQESFAENYKCFTAKDIALIFLEALNVLSISKLYALIGGSVGGGIAWEMLAVKPELAKHFIPIATDWKATDWLIANCHIQDSILNNSKDPLVDARLHAMTLYRTPESFKSKFHRAHQNDDLYSVESWLNHHGKTLSKRFKLASYKIMNQILRTVDITKDGESFIDIGSRITATIHIVTIPSDLFFKSEENWDTYLDLKTVKDNVFIHEIKSIHGHDAFLIEYQQLNTILKPIFQSEYYKYETDKPHYIRNR